MLLGIPPLLTGELLYWLDRAGHADAIALVDAHFPHPRVRPVIALPGAELPALVGAVRTVLPLDPDAPPALMDAPDGPLPVQRAALEAAGVGVEAAIFLGRAAFYEAVEGALLVVRTGETRPYGNILLRKGLVPDPRRTP